jgi:hypothetical protein
MQEKSEIDIFHAYLGSIGLQYDMPQCQRVFHSASPKTIDHQVPAKAQMIFVTTSNIHSFSIVSNRRDLEAAVAIQKKCNEINVYKSSEPLG